MPEMPNSRPGCRRRPYHFVCTRCSKMFTAKRRDARFCSAKCRKYASRAGAYLSDAYAKYSVLSRQVRRMEKPAPEEHWK